MMSGMIRLVGLTIAADRIDAMADFYRRVFGAVLEPRRADDFVLYVGTCAGVRLQLCPKALAGIEATQNLHQLTIAVPNVGATIELAIQHGGSALGESAIRDPDGNSIELVQ